METHHVGSAIPNTGTESGVPLNMVLLKEHTKHELIILTYRIAVIATGIVLAVLGYLLFSSMVFDYENTGSYFNELEKLAPGAVFALVGILFCISGITSLMPLPKFDKIEQTHDAVQADIEVPTLSPIGSPRFSDKLWNNNIRPIIEKVAKEESISRADRDLLRNWLRSL